MDAKAPLAAIVILLGLLTAFSFVRSDEPPNPVFPECSCPACGCSSCACTGQCACLDCSQKANSSHKPLEIVLITAEEWCRPCQLLAPHWSAVSASDPVCRTLDVSDADSDAAEEARKLGVSKVPTLVRLVNGKVERTSLVGGLNREGLRATVERWKEGRR